jgi:uncharacterized membrane protein
MVCTVSTSARCQLRCYTIHKIALKPILAVSSAQVLTHLQGCTLRLMPCATDVATGDAADAAGAATAAAVLQVRAAVSALTVARPLALLLLLHLTIGFLLLVLPLVTAGCCCNAAVKTAALLCGAERGCYEEKRRYNKVGYPG